MEMSRCVECGSSELRESLEQDSLTVAERSFSVEIPALRCAGCGAVFFDGPALGAFERAVAQELAQKGPATGEALRFMRKTIGLRAADLAEMLDVTPETVSRWETSKLALPRPVWLTMSSLVLDYEGTEERLRAAQLPPKSATVVRIKLPRTATG